MTESNYTAAAGHSRHPLWVRALALCIVWTIELQPAFAASTIAQQRLFTVTSVPPNVMLMFDDSGSMNQLSLNPPPGMETQTFTLAWFSGFCFYHNRMFGGLFVVGILLDTFFRKLPLDLPLSINWRGAIVLGIGVIYAVVRMQMAIAKKA